MRFRPCLTTCGHFPFQPTRIAGAVERPALPAPSAFRGTPNCKARTRNRAAGVLKLWLFDNQVRSAAGPDHLAPLCGKRSTREARRVRGKVQNRRGVVTSGLKALSTSSELAENPPHPKPPLRVGITSPRTRAEVMPNKPCVHPLCSHSLGPSRPAEYFTACQASPNRPRNWWKQRNKKRQRRNI